MSAKPTHSLIDTLAILALIAACFTAPALFRSDDSRIVQAGRLQ